MAIDNQDKKHASPLNLFTILNFLGKILDRCHFDEKILDKKKL